MTSLRFLPEQIELWPLARLKPYANNARTHSDDQIAKIAASLVEYGWTAPVMVADDGEIVAGHGRLLAAQHLGLNKVPIIRLSHLTPEQVRAYRIADNRLSELSGWDDELLAAELHALNAVGFDLGLTGFEGEDLDRLLAPLDEGDGLAGEDVIPEPPLNPVSRLGDLWLLGDHRLLCGDSTKAADVSRVMHNHKAILFASDPPYLVSYDGTNHPSKQGAADKNKDWSDTYAITWDDASQGPELYEGFIKAAIEHAILPNAAWYCWHASRRQAMVEGVWEKYGAFVHQQIVWAKDRGILTRSYYLWQHEPCFFGWLNGNKPPRVSDDYPSTVKAAADGEGGREDRSSDVKAGGGVRHPDASAREGRRSLLRALLRFGLADHRRRDHGPARFRDRDLAAIRRRDGQALADGGGQACHPRRRRPDVR